MNNEELQSPELELLRKGLGGAGGAVETPGSEGIRRRAQRQRIRRNAAKGVLLGIAALAAFGVWQAHDAGRAPSEEVLRVAAAPKPTRFFDGAAAVGVAPRKPDRLEKALARLEAFSTPREFTAPREEMAAMLLAAAERWESIDLTEARQRYREIIERFPESRAAAAAQRILYDTTQRETEKENA